MPSGNMTQRVDRDRQREEVAVLLVGLRDPRCFVVVTEPDPFSFRIKPVTVTGCHRAGEADSRFQILVHIPGTQQDVPEFTQLAQRRGASGMKAGVLDAFRPARLETAFWRVAGGSGEAGVRPGSPSSRGTKVFCLGARIG